MGIDPSLVALFSSAASVAGLGWWLSSQFRKVEKNHQSTLAVHETKDQERHEENLGRFAEIKVALARLGYKNGGTP